MHFTIPLFERRAAGNVECVTLGLGPNTQRRSGGHAQKIHRRLIDDLRPVVEKMRARDLPRLTMPRGLRLERVRLELTLVSPGERRKASGVYPIVIEPRWASEDARLFFAYHPERQEESLPIRPEIPLEEQLRPYFARAWAELDEDALEALASRGKERLDLLAFSCDTRQVFEDLPERPRGGLDVPPPTLPPRRRRALRVLPRIAQSLTALAAQGSLPCGMPRSPYREQLQLLLGPIDGRGRSAVIVGPPGAGKTTLIYQAIVDMLEADGYGTHRNLDRAREAWAVSGRRLVAGMSHVGDWEKRAVEVLEDARARPVILVVDDVHHFGRVGRSRESERSLADFFRGPVARRELTLLAACTREELRALEDDAPAFASLLVPVHLAPATPGEALRLMVREMRELERQHHVIMSPYALRAALELSSSLLSSQALPGKAIDLLRELARAEEGSPGAETVVLAPAVYRLLSRKTGVPELLLSGEDRLDPATIEAALRRQVMGQEEAILAAADLVCRVKAGLVDARRPYGVYLFTGPTGTGKTELAKCLAEYIYGSATRLVRIDMSELSGPDAASRLIGHRYRPEGLLTQKIQQQPFSLVLLDEIEKAHPSAQSLLLQLFEDGRLTDASGKVAHFNHAVIVMTSNLGQQARARSGFTQEPEGVLRDIARAARDFFPPELWNRIDRVVPFRPLTAEIAEQVAQKELDKLCQRRGLVERSIFVEAGKDVPARIAEQAFVATGGAREVKRFLEDHIGSRIAEAIASAKPAALQILRLHVQGEGFGLEREALDEAEPSTSTFALEPLLREPVWRLKERLPAVLGFVDALARGDDLARLSSRIRYHLGQHNQAARRREVAARAREHAEAIYNLDAMRAAIATFRERIEELRQREDPGEERHDALEMQRFRWISRDDEHGGTSRMRLFHPNQMPRPASRLLKEDVLACLAEGHALRRALRRVDDPTEHAIFIELLGAGRRHAGALFAGGAPGLLEWLIEAYRFARGEVEGAAIRRAGRAEVVTSAGADALNAPLGGGELGLATHVVLKIVGLCVRDFFALEEGSHVWTSLERGPEVVRVRVFPAPPGAAPEDVIEAHEAQQRAFDEALREGLPLPPNPAALLPVVRKIRGSPPSLPGQLAPIDIEDYVTGYAETMRVASVEEALAPLWLLRMSRIDEPDPTP
jgi:ATP-dependent Clp protease ATP-binding subunit ClpC